MPAGPGALSVHIERLVIDGALLDRHDALRLRMAVERELQQLLRSDGATSWRGGAVPRLAAPGINAAGASSPARLGSRIAGSVHQALGSKP